MAIITRQVGWSRDWNLRSQIPEPRPEHTRESSKPYTSVRSRDCAPTTSHGSRGRNQGAAGQRGNADPGATAHHAYCGIRSMPAPRLTCPGNREYSVSSDRSTGMRLPEECSRSPSRITDLLFSFPLLSQPIWPSRVMGSYHRQVAKKAI